MSAGNFWRLALRGTVLLAVVSTLMLGLPRSAVAHHILGIPHYSYDEDYPQTPVLTMQAEAGPYEIRMTAYPGVPTPGEPCYLNTYIRNRDSDMPYDGPVSLTVTRDRVFGPDPIVYGPTAAELSEAVYKFYPTFPVEASYTASLQLDVEGETWTVAVPVTVGEPVSPWGPLALAFAGLVLIGLVVRALRIKSRRLQAATSEA